MSATRPSPRMVAAETPSTRRKEASRFFTTTCCWPTISSTAMARRGTLSVSTMTTLGSVPMARMPSSSRSFRSGAISPRNCRIVAVARQRLDCLQVELHRLDDAGQREHEALGAGPHDHAVEHRQRQRQAHREAAAAARRRVHGDAAAQRLDVRAHHVHADAAARHVGDGCGRGEAGQEDQVVGFLGGRLVHARRSCRAIGPWRRDLLAVDAARRRRTR